MSLDLEKLNRDWLQAWTDKDVERLVGFYTEDVVYKDPQVPHGVTGHDALRAYLSGLFGATPAIAYNPEEIWATPTGFCGRWYAVVGDDPKAPPALRGFDLVILKGDKIAHNEVYVHNLAPPA